MNDEYGNRLRTVLEYIEANLQSALSLAELAEASHFSKYHFVRLFSALQGQAPMAYVTERRLLRAREYLRTTDKTMLDIASLCGFGSLSRFNAAFKKRYDTTPSQMRRKMRQPSNLRQADGKIREEAAPMESYDGTSNNHRGFMRRVWGMNIEVMELPSCNVAYVTHVGSYLDTYKAWGTLGAWAENHRLFPPGQQFIGISLDNPGVVDEDGCRYEACVTVPDELLAAGSGNSQVAYQMLPGGLFARYKFYDTIDKFAFAYQSVYGGWLPDSGYEPDDRHALEFCMNNPATDPEGKAKVDLYVPIRRLGG
ncbi:AraC family transcriptional regulator [Paenibacillus methanolicus]|uniref:AraC family transcriptional regulator n=1 Tax=Paenibacillus methanolicus TaxID=582686 RepID=A0A5S5BXD0_9BACL|nr:AraC family transcriptional regulator [Paenibacillus methanolicus]TYP71821.1 AraC family transcriptional regulator [Paenibacillus methanolicus]